MLLQDSKDARAAKRAATHFQVPAIIVTAAKNHSAVGGENRFDGFNSSSGVAPALTPDHVCQRTERERFPTRIDRFCLGAKQLPAIALCRKVGRPRRGVRRRYISLATCPQAMTPPDHNPAAASSSRAQNCGGGAKLPRRG